MKTRQSERPPKQNKFGQIHTRPQEREYLKIFEILPAYQGISRFLQDPKRIYVKKLLPKSQNN